MDIDRDEKLIGECVVHGDNALKDNYKMCEHWFINKGERKKAD